MFNIVLHEPRIPGNVGTIGRLAFALNCKLHLIKTLWFWRNYWKRSKEQGLIIGMIWSLWVWKYRRVLVKNPLNSRHFFATTKTDQVYFEQELKEGDFSILEEKMQDYLKKEILEKVYKQI